MAWFSALHELLTDDRLTANIIAGHGLVTITFLTAVVVRRFLKQAGEGLKVPFAGAWAQTLGDEAIRRGRNLVFWATLVLHSLIAGTVVCYHLAGRDTREDFRLWYHTLAADGLWRIGLGIFFALAALATAWVAIRIVRGTGPRFEKWAASLLGELAPDNLLVSWRRVAEGYLVLAIRLWVLWALGHCAGLGNVTHLTVGFAFRIITLLTIARLLTQGVRVAARALQSFGDRKLTTIHTRIYWDRLSRLIPFGERCFEAAVFVAVASHCIDAFYFIEAVRTFGHSIVRSIGIFFVTRVLIELMNVMLSEAFGVYRHDRPADQKARTLVPLLSSIGQYVFYIGSGILILDTLGVNIMPILAGVSVLGLTVGLGAQSMVTDVVSGFFILFESQYLVGDVVEIGSAGGTVEQVGIRVTHIRDEEGKLHIIPNGQIKTVVSFSKGYVNAVVDLKVSTGADLENIFHAMTEAGARLRRTCTEVLEPTAITGLVALDASQMTIRAVTRVEPGSHDRMENEFRRLLKQLLDTDEAAHAHAAPRAA
jgi:moderate conductance mechanosensitive channel